MQYTLGEIGQVYKAVDFECSQHSVCISCKYQHYCQLFDTIKVTVEDGVFGILADSILRE